MISISDLSNFLYAWVFPAIKFIRLGFDLFGPFAVIAVIIMAITFAYGMKKRYSVKYAGWGAFIVFSVLWFGFLSWLLGI